MIRVVLLALACLWVAAPAFAQADAAPAPARLLVVPFDNASRQGRVLWLGEGSAVMLTDELQAVGVAVITRDERRRAFEQLRVPPVATLSHATVIRLGQIVRASAVVVGAFDVTGDEVTVRARTIQLDSGRISPELVERGPLADIFGVYGAVARRLAPASPSAAPADQAHPPLAAFEQFIKGLLAEALPTRVSFLTQALRLFPTFQRARIALWDAYTDQGEHQRALGVVRQVPASSRLSRQARFRAALSMISLAQTTAAFSAFQQLNAERPDSALLNNLGVLRLRADDAGAGASAVSFFNEAVTADPTDPDLYFNLGYAYFLQRDLQGATHWLREAVRRNTADDAAHYVLGVALQASGNSGEAQREKDLARQLSSTYADWESRPAAAGVPRNLERLKTEVDVPAAFRVETAIVAAGQRDQQALALFHLERARRLLDQELDPEALAELRRVIYLSPYQSDAHTLLGRIYLRQGRTGEAIEALKIAVWSDPANADARTLLREAEAR